MNNTAAALVLCTALTSAANAGDPADRVRQRDPIVITSDRMKAAEITRQVEFSGNVTLKKEGLTLYSDTAIVFYDERSKSIRVIEALGNVIVRKEGSIAHAKRAQYYSNEEKIVLTGEARILENENEIGGDRITLFMRDERSVVEGGKVLLYQESGKESNQGHRKDEGLTSEEPPRER
ncbi:MAG TPA: lipopolysaccharide transport periplasmic protein LptA [Nitrospirota bacterium]|nr:lipopolysaccharide transport periplasmic protein LptA [Nitrospirota bacterium]